MRHLGNPRGREKTSMRAVAQAVGQGFYRFLFWPCPARLRRLLTPSWQAAEGEQDGNDEPVTICPLYLEVKLSEAVGCSGIRVATRKKLTEKRKTH